MDWNGELAELFGRANTEGIHTAIQGLRTKYNWEFDKSELFKGTKPNPASWDALDFHLTSGITLVIFLIGMLIWKMCFSKPDTVESTLPALSAPPMPASAQPQRHMETPVTNNQANKSNASIPIHINISLRNSPKKRRDIGTIFEVTSTSLI